MDEVNKAIAERIKNGGKIQKEPEIVDPGAENICISCE